MRYCGRPFEPSGIALIREWLEVPGISRFRLSREVCERLNWRRENGQLKDMSCRVALLRMQADGLITLPPPRNAQPVRYREHPEIERAVREPGIIPRVDLGTLTLDLVLSKADSLLWNAYIERHHYLGHQPLPGAQLRYFVRTEGHIIAALGFSASAWKTKPRDDAIGWTAEQRRRNLHLIVNNARSLPAARPVFILPWIHCKNLASRILALVSRRLPDDWHTRYSYRPVLLETFVEKPRFTGACYKAANWQHLGDTQGRGKLDTLHRHAKPIKSIWIYPLTRNFQRQLCNG